MDWVLFKDAVGRALSVLLARLLVLPLKPAPVVGVGQTTLPLFTANWWMQGRTIEVASKEKCPLLPGASLRPLIHHTQLPLLLPA